MLRCGDGTCGLCERCSAGAAPMRSNAPYPLVRAAAVCGARLGFARRYEVDGMLLPAPSLVNAWRGE
jgi:hypothetical protein